jgi:hypothetical protein
MPLTQRKALTGFELGDEVVVVGVKPLRHFQRADVRRPASQREVGGEILTIDSVEASGDRTERPRSVQDVVVENELAGRHDVDPRALGALPVAARSVREISCNSSTPRRPAQKPSNANLSSRSGPSGGLAGLAERVTTGRWSGVVASQAALRTSASLE